jgi:Histidine kinase-, DNA gyrase B-, and HSP90-like ATPase
LSGAAVADVIHLLAELIENATTLSPPYTSVRVSGDTVASGFAIEVEDRGLGISPERLAELNERLASPPEFNPSDSEHLGLFVVSQLAKRHGIRVTLRASAYGGTAVVVLIPQHLVVTEEAFRAGLPGQRAALTMPPPANGHQAAPAAVSSPAGPAGFAEPGGWSEPGGTAGLPQAPGVRISGPLRRSQPEGHSRGGAHAAPPRGAAHRGAASHTAALRGAADGEAGPAGGGPGGKAREELPGGTGPGASGGTEPPAFDVFAPLRRPLGAGGTPPAAPAGDPAYQGYAGSGPFPVAGGLPHPNEPVPFPGWTSRTTPGGAQGPVGTQGPVGPVGPVTPVGPVGPAPAGTGPGVGSGAGSGATEPPATPMIPVASPRTPNASGPPWELSGQTGPLPVLGDQSGNVDVRALPRRVRQANLAPQLRADPPRRLASTTAAASLTGGPTPAEIRQTMSALQRDWDEGRSQRAAGQGPAEPPPAPAAGASPSPPTGGDQGQPGGGESDET